MTIEERVSEETKEKLKAHRPKKKEVLTQEDLYDLMGINNPVYKKVKGRVRQR